ncbi:uncharacterized protein LOC118194715, partial [Stegodyphus dumicola]|uniref:uncharacterized protein LOC118194715 n=1 Tax=Stegodyphus dumicola TaxID=202533 RepID=UPI0015ADF40A
CSNIECATPDDLSELNDLLFVKPSENSEIHQKILDFSHFSFNENSIDYHYRKTLMHYMNYNIVRKIAAFLEIDNYENCTSQELASCIMKFLMEVKVPGKSKKRSVPKQCGSSKNALFNVEKSDVLNHTIKTSDVFSCKGIERLQCDEVSIHTKPRKAAVIHRLTKSSYSQIGIIKNNDVSQNLDDDPDGDSVPLYEILHHPTDEDLEKVISEIIKADLWSITMNGLIKKVFQQYSTLNLKYKTEFIKSKARQILLELRGNTSEFPVIM